MPLAYFVTHPNVIIDPDVPITQWPLSSTGEARMRQLLNQPWVATLGAVYSSAEQKAMDGARIISEHLGLKYEVVQALGEIDRSATGYLPPAQLAATVRSFFDYPEQSARGWETANAAQARIIGAIEAIAEKAQDNKDLALVSHGTVGALYLCYLKGSPISDRETQPGQGGGSYYCFEVQTGFLVHDWKPIDG